MEKKYIILSDCRHKYHYNHPMRWNGDQLVVAEPKRLGRRDVRVELYTKEESTRYMSESVTFRKRNGYESSMGDYKLYEVKI